MLRVAECGEVAVFGCVDAELRTRPSRLRIELF